MEWRMSWFDTYVKPVLETVTAVGTLVALIALVVTVIKNRRDEEASKQQVLLDQCRRTLEWAYNALMPDPHAQMAEPNRLNWITAARHIRAYQDLRRLITMQPQVRICDDFEEFWRHRFYLALSDQSLSTAYYWAAPSPFHVNLDTLSALIVVDFSGWPDGKVDPTELSEEEIEVLKARNGLKGNAGRGLRAYLNLLAEHNRATRPASNPASQASTVEN